MNTLTLILAFLITAIFIFFAVKEKKWAGKKASSSKKKNTSSKPKRPFFSEGFKETIRWTIFLSICLILLLFVVGKVASFFNETTQTTYKYISREKILANIYVYLGKEYGQKISLKGYLRELRLKNSKSNLEFDFIGATVPYAVKNAYGTIVEVQKGEDASSLLGYSSGNISLQFKSAGIDGQNGSLIIKVFIIKKERIKVPN